MKRLCVLALSIIIICLCGCGNGKAYTASEVEEMMQQAYREGYASGYDQGMRDQWDEDCEELLIDGCSIKNIRDSIYHEFGMTPDEAFNIVDSYECDPSHDGITWSEYQKAIEAIYCTVSIFPSE